ncbi:hypothetical protein AB0I28_33715 [Phytomonospora sp. NPDC050363]|uniref:hypothetical protein n=1 Tax=Phytomonospora sp. NPDC050363 TaxID=3155642 RepID=UPI003411D860
MSENDGNDAYVSNDDADSQYAGNMGPTAAVDTDPVSTIPLVEATKNTFVEGIAKGDMDALFAGVMDFAGNAISFVADPLNWLITAGLTFLIDFFQPLEDLLSLVTGNAERVEGYANKWKQAAEALPALGDATKQAADDGLVTWKGKDAEAAKARLGTFSEAVKATAEEVNSVASLLVMFSKLMSAAQQIIIGLIATLVEWMIVTWIAAMAAAVPTAGASTAAAGVATTTTTAVQTSRAVKIIDTVVSFLAKIGNFLNKLLPPSLRQAVARNVTELQAFRAFDVKTAMQVMGNSLKGWTTYSGSGASAASGAEQAAANNGPDMSEQDIEDGLDKDK